MHPMTEGRRVVTLPAQEYPVLSLEEQFREARRHLCRTARKYGKKYRTEGLKPEARERFRIVYRAIRRTLDKLPRKF